jgi:hypothetical protein
MYDLDAKANNGHPAAIKYVAAVDLTHESLPPLSEIAEYEVKLGELADGEAANVPRSGLLI